MGHPWCLEKDTAASRRGMHGSGGFFDFLLTSGEMTEKLRQIATPDQASDL
jgi:hypothetical protein